MSLVEFLGVSPPISLDTPAPANLDASRRLEATIQALGSFESDDRATLRGEVSGMGGGETGGCG